MSEYIRLSIQMIKFCKDIIGKEGPIALNTGILYHDSDDYDNKFINDDIVWIGEKGKVIDFDDILKTFENIDENPKFEEAFEDRGYFCEGLDKCDYDKCGYHYEFYWGS